MSLYDSYHGKKKFLKQLRMHQKYVNELMNANGHETASY
jgi:hypothetical protein